MDFLTELFAAPIVGALLAAVVILLLSSYGAIMFASISIWHITLAVVIGLVAAAQFNRWRSNKNSTK